MSKRRIMATIAATSAISIRLMMPGVAQALPHPGGPPVGPTGSAETLLSGSAEALNTGSANQVQAPPPGTTGSALQGARFAQALGDLFGPPQTWTYLNLLTTGSGGQYCSTQYGGLGPVTTCW